MDLEKEIKKLKEKQISTEQSLKNTAWANAMDHRIFKNTGRENREVVRKLIDMEIRHYTDMIEQMGDYHPQTNDLIERVKDWNGLKTMLSSLSETPKDSNKEDAQKPDINDEGGFEFSLDFVISYHGCIMADIMTDHFKASYEVIEADNIEEAKEQFEEFYNFIQKHYEWKKKIIDLKVWNEQDYNKERAAPKQYPSGDPHIEYTDQFEDLCCKYDIDNEDFFTEFYEWHNKNFAIKEPQPEPIYRCAYCLKKFQYTANYQYHLEHEHFNDSIPKDKIRGVLDKIKDGEIETYWRYEFPDCTVPLSERGEQWLLIKEKDIREALIKILPEGN
ncbi:MAG: hypothetical protein U9Q73_01835 [Nanoarchaeota archaeon]|nr:hypothetical protein [Nanoarchaeota archaeon]